MVTDFRYPELPWLDGRCVQGPGTYSPRHGWCAITSDSSFIESSCRLQSELRPAFEIRIYSHSSCPLYWPLYYVCGPRRKGRDDLTSSPPSSLLAQAVSLESPTEWWQLVTGVALVAGLNLTPHGTSWRQPCSTLKIVRRKPYFYSCQFPFKSW